MKSILRNIKICAVVVATILSAASCLTKYPQSAILEKDAMKNYNDAEQMLTGIYALLKSSSLYSGYLTLLPDVQCDMVYAVDRFSNVYGNIWQWDIRSTTAEITSVYGSLYNVISNCNFFLERIDAVIAAETNDDNIDTLTHYKGEAYAIRALAYSELIKCFCKDYKGDDEAKQELGVVLRRYYSAEEPSVRASLYDSYQFVLADLAMAERLLDEEADAASSVYMTRAMAEALHARVALYMRDWESAVEYSSRLIDNSSFALSSVNYANVVPPYSDYDVMWGYDISSEIIWRLGFTTTSYGGALGQPFLNFNIDYYYFYPDYVPAESALRLYGSGDARHDAFFYYSPTGYDGYECYLLVKYYGNRDFIDNSMIYHVTMPKPFRLSEQYLIRAEAYCRLGEYSKASKDMTKLRQARYTSGGGINLTAANFLQQISDERVRELFMEGFRLHDLKRWGSEYNNGVSFERTPQQHSLVEGSSLKIMYDNPLFVWPIPQHELEAPGSQVVPNESNN